MEIIGIIALLASFSYIAIAGYVITKITCGYSIPAWGFMIIGIIGVVSTIYLNINITTKG